MNYIIINLSWIMLSIYYWLYYEFIMNYIKNYSIRYERIFLGPICRVNRKLHDNFIGREPNPSKSKTQKAEKTRNL